MTAPGRGTGLVALDPSHLAAVARLDRRLFQRSWDEASLEVECRRPGAVALAARQAGQLVGYLLGWCAGGEFSLNRVAVAPEARRQGVALLLVAEALRQATARGCSLAVLEVEGTNTSALALYARLGFETTGGRPGYYPGGGDALAMALPLPAPSLAG